MGSLPVLDGEEPLFCDDENATRDLLVFDGEEPLDVGREDDDVVRLGRRQLFGKNRKR